MRIKTLCIGLSVLTIAIGLLGCNQPTKTTTPASTQTSPAISSSTIPLPTDTIKLPAPKLTGPVSLEETLLERRSVREYTDEPLSLEEVSQLLWAAQGITESWGGRTAPSAGGLYPLELYLAANSVDNLVTGVYKYQPSGQGLLKIKEGDVRVDLSEAALGQEWVKEGAIVIVIAAVYKRTTQKYGDRGIQYVHIEVGHAAQNICLQATALNLGAVTVGAFYDDRVKSVLGMTDNETPLYVIPLGKKR